MVLTSKDLEKFRNGGTGDGAAKEDHYDHDDNSSISGGSSGKTGSGSGPGGGGGGAQGEANCVLSSHQTESRLVNCSKSVVYIILFLAAVSVSAACYLRLVKEEETTMLTEVRRLLYFVWRWIFESTISFLFVLWFWYILFSFVSCFLNHYY